MKWSKISNFKIKKILRSFAAELTSTQASKQLGFNRHTTDHYYQYFREQLALYEEAHFKQVAGNIKIDELFFGGKHIAGLGLKARVPVVGIIQRKGMVYTELIPNIPKKMIMPLIKDMIKKSKSQSADQWQGYDGLVLGGKKHFRINLSGERGGKFSRQNAIESFWSYTKRKIMRHNGIRHDKLYWYLKEAEFRFNHKNQDIYKLLLKIINL